MPAPWNPTPGWDVPRDYYAADEEEPCRVCKGKGYLLDDKWNPNRHFKDCPACDGTGREPVAVCTDMGK